MCENAKPNTPNTPSQPGQPGEHLAPDQWEVLKALGWVSESEVPDDQHFGPVIDVYSRKQAIEDGVLVDLTACEDTRQLLREAGFKLPIAMTNGAFLETIEAGVTYDPDGYFVYPAGQSFTGRLWDVLTVLHFTIRKATRNGGNPNSVHFKVDVDVHGDGRHNTVRLWCPIGPGDDGEPVLTIMLKDED